MAMAELNQMVNKMSLYNTRDDDEGFGSSHMVSNIGLAYRRQPGRGWLQHDSTWRSVHILTNLFYIYVTIESNYKNVVV
jgi:hypothetical protein